MNRNSGSSRFSIQLIFVFVVGLSFEIAHSNQLAAQNNADTAGKQSNQKGMLDVNSTLNLQAPALATGRPAAGARVNVTPPEYASTDVHHTIYLPPEWKPEGSKTPIVFEYTGNYHPRSGSTGKTEDAALGYGLSAGKYIWVSLPYVNKAKNGNAVTWWGDETATLEYAKTNVPKIISQYNADPDAVILCGFSRGAIGVNYLGLHDDEIAKLWSAFFTHDHFDGVKAWQKPWGAPLEKYRSESSVRLKRIAARPFWVSQNGNTDAIESLVKETLQSPKNFTFSSINTKSIFGNFPNELAKHPHTDKWLNIPSENRKRVWSWVNDVVGKNQNEFVDMFANGDLSEWRVGRNGTGWTLKNGIVHLHQKKAGSLMTRKKYKNFVLKFEWKIAEGGNSGVIYRAQKGRGLEYQVLDDARHVRGKNPIWSAAAIYDLANADINKLYNEAGKWNSAKIVANGFNIEHWINGQKAASIEIGSATWDKQFAASKYPKYELNNFANVPSPITFQDHGAEVWYRNVLIRELETVDSAAASQK